MLRTLAGEPMLAWVYRAARACPVLNEVLIATDAPEIMRLAERLGFPAVFTPQSCRSGTDRVHAVAENVRADIYVNLQGDEPLLQPAHVEALLAPMLADPSIGVSTLATPCSPELFRSPHAVKVVRALDGRALYFSRAPIPCDRDRAGAHTPLKHLGLYAFRREALDRFVSFPQSPLEETEKLEQLRLLENDIPVHVALTPHDTRGVDTEEDLRAVEALLLAGPPFRIT